MCSVMIPPSSGPIARAIAETPAQIPIAVPRSRAWNVAEMIDSVAGIISAAPTPWTPRAAISSVAPDERPQASEESVKTIRPIVKISRRPSRSPSFPPVSSSEAKLRAEAATVHSSSDVLIPRSALIAGSATFTTVLSSMIMKRAKQSAPNVHQRRFSSAKIFARTAPPTGRKLACTRLALTSQSVKVTLAGVEVIWRPDQEARERTNALRLARKLGFDDYASLVRFSQDEPERFWPAAIEDMELEFSRPWDAVVDESRGPEWATWFVGGRLNLAWNCVHRWAQGERADAPAAVWQSEDGQRRSLTYREVSAEVTRLAEALARLGVEPGDRVALFLPMSPEVAIASHACAHLGAIQVPIFSGFAAPAIAARLQHSEAKVVVTADGSLRRGREVPMKELVDEAVRESPSVEHVVVWQRLGNGAAMQAGRDVFWSDAVAGSPGELEPLEVDSEHPYLLTYTSGTTGLPKGVLHVQGGFLVSITREVAYQADARPEDVIHFVTDMGWIMGPWEVVGGMALGCTIVFAEGAPDWPAADRLWGLVDSERVSILGLSPTLVRALIPHGAELVERHDVSPLRVLVTTGEPWNPEPYRWLFEHVGGGRCPIINCSGGTEVGACFLSPTPAVPIKACSLGGPALGMAMDVVDADGLSVRGEVGELVCRRPFPGMTRGFWGDPERYLDTYWRRLPGIWVHGDWAFVDDEGFWFLHGRSDDTLNIAGKRLGPSELESAVVAHPAVAEAAAVGVPHEVKGEVAWVFCALVPGVEPSDELAAELRGLAADELGKAFAPERVLFVSALPKTRSAKIVRRAVRAKALGTDPGDLSSLENPETLEEIEHVATN